MSRLLATNAALSLVLVTCFGLLLFPTECTCGAAEPHPHALFMLPGHHHGTHAPASTASSDQKPLLAAVPSGPHGSLLASAVLPAVMLVFFPLLRQRVPRELVAPPRRWSPRVEPPPPRR